MKNEHLELAIKKGGGIVAFAAALDVTHQAVSAWRKKGYVPLERAIQIEQLYKISATEMCDPRVAQVLAARLQ